MKHKTAYLLIVFPIVAVAMALRLPQLDARPMHADEAVQAAIFRDLWQHGHYAYDPNEYHGPALAYATLPAPIISGASSFAETTESTYRVVPALFGIATVLLVFLLADGLGWASVSIAAMLLAVSPALVFYSRYYIHETLLAFFALAAITSLWRYAASARLRWCVLAGICVGLMQATKETAVLSYFAAAVATLLVFIGRRQHASKTLTTQKFSWPHVAAGLATATLVAALLFSSFLTNWQGPFDALRTYLPWFSRAGGNSSHIHSWSFYLQRLFWWQFEDGPVWSEAFIVLLAVLGGGCSLLPAREPAATARYPLARWLAYYTLTLAICYCVIPYKTPWCMIQFLTGMVLLAGYGASCLLRSLRGRWMQVIVAILLAGGAGHLAWQAYRASYVMPADVRNPYVYAQTSADILLLQQQLEGLARAAPGHEETAIKVIWTDTYYWPLPWYLRRFDHVQWWRKMPADPVAPIVLAAPDYNSELEHTLGRDYIMVIHQLRPRTFVQLWVEYDLWESHLRRLGRIK